jgi:hypothetical protein
MDPDRDPRGGRARALPSPLEGYLLGGGFLPLLLVLGVVLRLFL